MDLYELNQSDTVTHPFVTIVIELQVARAALQADRELLKQLEAQGGLRADRSRIKIEESSGSEPTENGEELFDSVAVGTGSTP